MPVDSVAPEDDRPSSSAAGGTRSGIAGRGGAVGGDVRAPPALGLGPGVVLLTIMRHPLERALSQWQHDERAASTDYDDTLVSTSLDEYIAR